MQAYSISGTGVPTAEGTTDAAGTMSAFVKAHLQEGRMFHFTVFNPDAVEQPDVYQFDKAEDLTYTQSAGAGGLIRSFAQSFAYQDGIRRF